MTVAATGDSLMVAPFPKSYARDMADLREYLSDADVRITNLETNVGEPPSSTPSATSSTRA